MAALVHITTTTSPARVTVTRTHPGGEIVTTSDVIPLNSRHEAVIEAGKTTIAIEEMPAA